MRNGRKLRGSEKHLVDLLDSKLYSVALNKLLNGVQATIAESAEYAREGEIPDFCRGLNLPGLELAAVSDWWLPKARGRPVRGATWDLLSACVVNDRPGLLIVEAKAHEDELDYSGKPLSRTASVQSKQNHEHIRKNLREASDALDKLVDGEVSLSIDSHYQLANRIAWAWKLASSGVPTILLYLGFTGDQYFRYDYFRDADHWQRAMGAYMHGVFPKGLPGKIIHGKDGGSFTLLVKSLPVAAVST
jgi:hypothetical protein